MVGRDYDRNSYEKMYDLIELIYILNRLSNNSYVDERSKKYMIGMLNDVESIRNNFDKYRDIEPDYRISYSKSNKRNDWDFNNGNSFINKVINFLNSLNDDY